ncbi:hypothetical protein SeMB42_g07545 [Synchytrium endobioticum]|uniref:Uncharacterized protein n=1 Tax=Synchytrium endobioticum TaxID=286115 RepID=A0A507C653_9FUNG|nr:hypothetical protein SeMB42_g07545 [Synchytrium endobioticum]
MCAIPYWLGIQPVAATVPPPDCSVMPSTLNRIFAAKPAPLMLLGASAGVSFWAYFFLNNSNQSISHTSLFKAILFELRADPRVSEWVGGTRLDYNHTWIHGNIHPVRGKADVEFVVKGAAAGEPVTVKFKGRKKPDRDEWVADEFMLQKPDGSVLQL